MRKYLHAYAPSLGELWLLVMVLFCIGGGIVTTVTGMTIQYLFRLDPESSKSLFVGLYPLGFSLVIPFIYLRAREQYQQNPHLWKPVPDPCAPSFGKLPVLLVFFLLLLLVPFFNTSMEPFSMWIPMPEFIKDIFASLTQNGWVSFVTVVVMAPLLEEWLLRGVVLKALLHRGYAPAAAICWSALMFGVMHMNPWQTIPAFLMGLLFGWIYWRTRSLWTTIFMHAVNNGMAFLLSIFFPELPEDISTLDLVGSGRYPWVLGGAILASMLIIWLLHTQLSPATSLFKKRDPSLVAV